VCVWQCVAWLKFQEQGQKPAPQPPADLCLSLQGFEFLDSISPSKEEHRDCSALLCAPVLVVMNPQQVCEMWNFPDSVQQRPNLLPSPGEEYNAQVILNGYHSICTKTQSSQNLASQQCPLEPASPNWSHDPEEGHTQDQLVLDCKPDCNCD
jgi:hypothetical protein